MNTYLGNRRGLILGPYAPCEIQARLFGQRWLGGPEHLEVYAIRARDRFEAYSKLHSHLARIKDKDTGEGS